MTKELKEKFFDVRVVDRYKNKGIISQSDIEEHYNNLPNDEDNFELVMIEEDDIGMGDTLSEEEIQAMPAMTEEGIDDFEFMDDNSTSQITEEQTESPSQSYSDPNIDKDTLD